MECDVDADELTQSRRADHVVGKKFFLELREFYFFTLCVKETHNMTKRRVAMLCTQDDLKRDFYYKKRI